MPVGLVLAATALVIATIALIWFVAVPLGPVVCPAIMPPPTNCVSTYREGSAVVIMIFALVVYAATVGAALTIGRRHAAVVTGGVVLLGVVFLLAWPLVALLPGFALAGG